PAAAAATACGPSAVAMTSKPIASSRIASTSRMCASSSTISTRRFTRPSPPSLQAHVGVLQLLQIQPELLRLARQLRHLRLAGGDLLAQAHQLGLASGE